MTDEETIRAALPHVRRVAQNVGPLHAAWDVIFDAEAWLEGKQTLVRGSHEEVGRWLAEILACHIPSVS